MTKARLLVVEDEAELRADLIELLELCDFEVDGSGNGAEAFALIQRDQPDLVICDVQLPGMTGIEILKSLLGARGYRPFMVMFTAYGDEGTLQELRRLGAHACLVKPVGFDAMLTQIHALLATERPSAPAPDKAASAILVVEHEADLAEEIAELLDSHGVQAHCADSIDVALQCLRDTPEIRGVLLDIGLGRENGLDLIRAAASDSVLAGRDLKFLLISGTSIDREPIHQLPIIPAACLQKPVRPNDLLAFAAEVSRPNASVNRG